MHCGEPRNQRDLIEVNIHSYEWGATVAGRMVEVDLGNIEEAQAALRESIERSKALADEAERLVRQLRSDAEVEGDTPDAPDQ